MRRQAAIIGLFFWTALAMGSSAQLDQLWQSANHALSKQNYAGAIELLDQWEKTALTLGVRSPQLHYNQAVAYLNLKQPGPAVFHLLTSAYLTTSPLKVWQTLDSISEIQRQLGVKDTLTDSFFARFFFLLNHNLSWLFIAIAFWVMVVVALLVWHKQRYSGYEQMLTGLAVVLLVAVGTSWINGQLYCQFAVVNGNDRVSADRAPVFSSSQMKKEQLLLELPSGTLVNTAAGRLEAVPITAPIAGWIEASSLRKLDLSR